MGPLDAAGLALFALIERSHDRLVGRPLAPGAGSDEERARWAYADAPFGLLAHDGGADPRFTYANRTAQGCFEYAWEELVGMPSRLSTAPAEQEDRQDLLRDVRERGFAEGYRGLRRAASGRGFWIEDVRVWNLLDEAGTRIGQAALFPRWTDA